MAFEDMMAWDQRLRRFHEVAQSTNFITLVPYGKLHRVQAALKLACGVSMRATLFVG